MNNEKELYTVDEVAEILRIGRTNAYNLVKDPSFPHLKVGKQIRIPRSAFYKWLEKNTNNSQVS